MSDFQEFLENSLQQKIKQLIPLTGGASADINRIVLANEDELIVRRTLSQEKSVMAGIPAKKVGDASKGFKPYAVTDEEKNNDKY